MMWNNIGGYGWGWIAFGGLHMLLFWALIILGIVTLLKWLKAPASEDSNVNPAMEILRERYARGEIEEQEYDDKKTTLMK